MKRELRNFDYVIAFCVFVLISIGLMFVYSASNTLRGGLSDIYISRQLQWLTLGLLLSALIISIDYRKFIDFSYLIYFLNIAALFALLLVGEKRMGAQRWMSFGGFGFQPSEFAKITLIFVLATFLGKRKDSLKSPINLVAAVFFMAPLFVLIAIQPDLGSALLLIPIMIAIVFVADVSLKGIMFFIAGSVISMPFFWHFLKDYQKKRLLVFINPNADPLGSGYTIIQSKIAIGSGQFFGKGWLAGTQSQLNFLPERHTDFIFSVIGEEWGFLGALTVLALYFIIIYRGIIIIEKTSDIYGKLIAAGVVTLLSFQVIVNIGMTMGFLPVVGITLPFISYGGTSIITSLVAVSLLLNVGTRRPLF